MSKENSGLTMLSSTPLILNKASMRKYDDLSVPCEQIVSTYVWVDGTGTELRSKDRTLRFIPKTHKDLPIWCFNGANTKQAKPENSDTYIYPQTLYNDPFRRGSNVIALCDTYQFNYDPTESNFRKECVHSCEKAEAEEAWFGFQQDLMLMGQDGQPLGWPQGGFPAPPGPYYCGVGANRVLGRDLIEAFYKCCLYAGVNLFGTNPGLTPAQWCIQTGPDEGIKASDDVWMSRYILGRLAEEYGVLVSLKPLPVRGWPGCGLSVYFSSADTRDDDGILAIERYIDKLSRRHERHMAVYDANGGKDNEMRLTGGDNVCKFKDFTAGVANRSCSIRIPRQVSVDKRGYFEDTRPASNADPYRVVDAVIKTCLFNE